ncbi:MAG: LLM class flavin-dependent oxidoreductase [Proteobacteria bacterium]|nr:LLM class flavin-dependent oxidoreductase [Pseudomonadota bacterium]
MRFGFMEDFRNPVKWRRPFPEFYAQILEQIIRGEELGYDNVWLTEHHFTDDGYNPSLMTTAAAVATRTEKIRIGTFILLLPYQHPMLVAEEVANVDIFSDGRFDFGIGQGYSYHEFNALCMDRAERGSRMREGIDIIKRLFTEERVTYDGKYTQLKDARLSPKPVQQPYPPIWIGARVPKAIKKAAELGYHLMGTIGPDPAPLYIETLKDQGLDPADFKIAQLRMVYCAESEDEAWDECQDHLFHMLEFYQDILSNAKDAEGDDAPLPVTKPADMRHSVLADHFMIGTPDQVNAKLEAFRDEYQCTDFILGTQFPGLDPAKGTRSLELFAREVMPNFR